MKISDPPDRDSYVSQFPSDLERLLEQPLSNEERPCPGCVIYCKCSNYSRTCCCQCSERCSYMAEQLSSEGDQYPIEPRVSPLVYGLASIRVVVPCWSCQGHLSRDRHQVKPPQVWLYSTSLFYVHLIGQFLTEEHEKHRCHHLWQIRSGPYAQGQIPIFIIEPRMSPLEIIQTDALKILQRDLYTLGRNFEQRIR